MNSVITYSPAYTLVPSYECFNRCSYCNFRTDPGTTGYMSSQQLKKKLEVLEQQRIAEILILGGEVHPESNNRQKWFTKVQEAGELSLALGYLPHTNVGPLSYSEMERLKQINVSMGLMLEQLNPRFMQTVHKNAPSKEPKMRSHQLEQAGKLKIPFTTGILLGIGETKTDVKESLEEIARIQNRWGHIQEVILQPHSVGSQQELESPRFDPQKLPEIIILAREILPVEVAIQIPPNLVPEPAFLLKCLAAGATDLGGISPIDEVNPDYPHPTYKSLSAILNSAGWKLKPRLPVYPQYYSWLSPTLKKVAIAKKNRLIWES